MIGVSQCVLCGADRPLGWPCRCAYEATEEVPTSPPTLRDLVLADLAAHPDSTAREVCDRLGLDHYKVKLCLNSLKQDGKASWSGPRSESRWRAK